METTKDEPVASTVAKALWGLEAGETVDANIGPFGEAQNTKEFQLLLTSDSINFNAQTEQVLQQLLFDTVNLREQLKRIGFSVDLVESGDDEPNAKQLHAAKYIDPMDSVGKTIQKVIDTVGSYEGPWKNRVEE